MGKKLTDVAALAGVSPTTVSRVLNQKGYLSKKTIEKVYAAMRELSYRPNNFARGLQGKSAKLVGLIFPESKHIFYAELIDHLEKELFNRGYKTILCNSEHHSEKELEYLEMLKANYVDGIISGSHTLQSEDYDKVKAPIISFDRLLSPNIPIVSSDNFAGGVLAAKTLLRAKCQKPLMIAGSEEKSSPTYLRQEGFASVFPQAKIVNLPSNFSPTRKKMEIKKALLEEKPDGIFFSDDLTAIVGLNLAQEMEISVPEQLKVVGYDGTYFVENYYPQLCTIKQPLGDLAVLLVDLLIQKMEGKELPEKHYLLPVRLLTGHTAI